MDRHIDHGDPAEALDEAKALEVAQTLERCYPDHPWLVCFQGQTLIVRHLLICDAVRTEIGQDGFGFLIKPENFRTCSAKALAHTAMMAGGMMLERFSLPRGAWRGEAAIVPREWQHKQTVLQ